MSAVITPEQYREQARLFDVYAQKLREIADLMEGRKMVNMSASITPTAEINGALEVKPATRADQIAEYLRANPGKKRGEICRGTGIPSGTVDMVLRRPEFVRGADGRYTLKP